MNIHNVHPVWNSAWERLFYRSVASFNSALLHSGPRINQIRPEIVHIPRFCPTDATPYFLVNRIRVVAVRRPQICGDECSGPAPSRRRTVSLALCAPGTDCPAKGWTRRGGEQPSHVTMLGPTDIDFGRSTISSRCSPISTRRLTPAATDWLTRSWAKEAFWFCSGVFLVGCCSRCVPYSLSFCRFLGVITVSIFSSLNQIHLPSLAEYYFASYIHFLNTFYASVATYFRCGRIPIDHFVTNVLLNLTVKEFSWKPMIIYAFSIHFEIFLKITILCLLCYFALV